MAEGRAPDSTSADDTAVPKPARRRRRPMDEVIEAGMAPALLSLGFKRTKRQTYVLETPTLVKFVEFRAGKYGDTEFSDASGVFVRPLQTLMDELAHPGGMETRCAGTHMPGHISQSARIQEILHRRNVWQQTHPPGGLRRLLGLRRRPPASTDEVPFSGLGGWEPYGKPVDQMGRYIRDLWLRHIKPWLDRCDDLNFVADEFLKQRSAGHASDVLYPALRCIAGNTNGVEKYLERAVARGQVSYETMLAHVLKETSPKLAPLVARSSYEDRVFYKRIALSLADKFSISLPLNSGGPFPQSS